MVFRKFFQIFFNKVSTNHRPPLIPLYDRFGLKTAIFQILKTVQDQDQDRFGQDQDLKKMVLRPKLVLKGH